MISDRVSEQLPEPDSHHQTEQIQPETRINHFLRRARKERTWSQAELAERIGVAKETISRWEHGASRPQPNQLRKLCEAFDRKPGDLGYALEPLEEESTGREQLPCVPPIELSQEAGTSDTFHEPLTRASGALVKPWAAQPSLTRRRLVAGLALAGLAGGTLFTWQTLTKFMAVSGSTQASNAPARPRERYWPAITYDPYQYLDVVRTIQWMLQARNYNIGPTGVDGYFGPHTLAAVITFQINQHLQDTGNVDGPTWERLIIPSQVGSHGSQVMALQERLQVQGFLPKQTASSNFDLQTEQAVRRFQQHMHLPEQGQADLNTWCVLVGGILRA
jgi:transcriptional regulator with XRE-family HTH domain/peptidoglycan hydrolase-like protein with peptidoglycan-binding domain